VQSLGSTAGIQAAINRVAQIGMSSRDLAPDEAAQLDQLVIAHDALRVLFLTAPPLKHDRTIFQPQASTMQPGFKDALHLLGALD